MNRVILFDAVGNIIEALDVPSIAGAAPRVILAHGTAYVYEAAARPGPVPAPVSAAGPILRYYEASMYRAQAVAPKPKPPSVGDMG